MSLPSWDKFEPREWDAVVYLEQATALHLLNPITTWRWRKACLSCCKCWCESAQWLVQVLMWISEMVGVNNPWNGWCAGVGVNPCNGWCAGAGVNQHNGWCRCWCESVQFVMLVVVLFKMWNVFTLWLDKSIYGNISFLYPSKTIGNYTC